MTPTEITATDAKTDSSRFVIPDASPEIIAPTEPISTMIPIKITKLIICIFYQILSLRPSRVVHDPTHYLVKQFNFRSINILITQVEHSFCKMFVASIRTRVGKHLICRTLLLGVVF